MKPIRQAQGKKDVLIYFDLITSLKTTREVDDLSSEIDILMSALFKSEKVSLQKALTSITLNSANRITAIFEKFNLDMTDKGLIRDFLDTLTKLIKKFKVIKLTLAFDPTGETIDNIHEFVSENIGIGYVLDIEVLEGIYGGAVIMFNGKYKDFTLRKTLEETFRDNRRVILNLFQDLSPKNRDAETSSA